MGNEIIISDMLFPQRNEADINSIFGNTHIKGIEMRSGSFIDNEDMSGLSEYKDMLLKNKIPVVSVHAPFMKQDISSGDEYTRRRSVRDVEKAVIIAHDINAQYMVVHCSGKGEFNEESFDRLEESLKEISVTAGSRGIEMLIENTIPGMLVYTKKHMKQIIQMGYSICFDWGHAMLSGIDPEMFLQNYGKTVKLIHFHVNNGEQDQHRFDLKAFDRVKDIANEHIIIEIETDSKHFNYMDIIEGGLDI